MSNAEKKRIISSSLEVQSSVGSKTVCSAKWLQTTINLYNGTTHSCHHCPRHTINVDDLEDNPAALHNTEEKIIERKEMLSNEKPKACSYCWDSEKDGALSDRYLKTSDPVWSLPHIERLKEDNPNPSYLEIAFDTTCNLKCMYCGPAVSSKWFEEVTTRGKFPVQSQYHDTITLVQQRELAIPHNQYNPFKEAFWEWWPSLKKDLSVFRITGGEPLLSKSAWTVLDSIVSDEGTNPELSVIVNTNLSVPRPLIDRLIKLSKSLEDKVKNNMVVVSCESKGEASDYVRHGMVYNEFLQNCKDLLAGTDKTEVSFTMTVNPLSIFGMRDFMEDLFDLRDTYGKRVLIYISYVRWPEFMDVRVLDRKIASQVLSDVADLINERGEMLEKEQISRLLAYLETDIERPMVHKKDLIDFLNEWDRRHGTDYKKILPELDQALGLES